MVRIDLYGEKFTTYNDDGTITVRLLNSGEPSIVLTVSREQEFALKDLLQMIDSRNEVIDTLETAIAGIGKAHHDEADALEGETKEIYEDNCIYPWEKKVEEVPIIDERDRAA